MQPRWPVKRLARALAASLILAGAGTGIVPAAASAASCQSWSGLQPPSPGADSNQLNGIAVLSPCDAWTVGSFDNGGSGVQTLIEHWDGTAWTAVTGANPGTTDNVLYGVRAVSSSNVWAVGAFDNGGGSGQRTLIEHWDGTAWTVVAGPNPGANNSLVAVRPVSANNAWAVGTSSSGATIKTLIAHWNGHTWTQMASPSPGQKNELNAVAATSASDAWAAGAVVKGTKTQTLMLHWNGHTWATVTTPNPGPADSFLTSVHASSGDAWAVGTPGPS